MSKPMHYRCPNCGKYIRGAVKETRMDRGGIYRKRVCENCQIIIETMELIVGFYKKKSLQKRTK